jgi:hypothetical protein
MAEQQQHQYSSASRPVENAALKDHDGTEQQTNESLSNRLSQYSIVSAVCQGYIAIKEKNYYLKAGLETAENLTQPVLKKIDDTLHLDDKGVAILDKIENTATDISQKVTNYKDQAIETSKSLIQTANRPVHQLLDYTEALLDHILPHYPPEPEIVTVEPEDDQDGETFLEYSETQHISDPITRMKRMTIGVPRRITTLAYEKITPLQSDTVAYTVAVLRHAYDKVNFEEKKTMLYENAALVHKYLDDKKDEASKLFTPAKEILERQTADIKDKTMKGLVTAVSSIAHVSEILRRQLIGRVIDQEKLHAHLEEVTRLTKMGLLKLKENELKDYINKFQQTCGTTIQSLIDLTYAYTPEQLSPLVEQLSNLSHSRIFNRTPENKQVTENQEENKTDE